MTRPIYDSTTYPQRDPATLDATPWARREPPAEREADDKHEVLVAKMRHSH